MRSFLICLFVVGVLAGCGSDDTNCAGQPGCSETDGGVSECDPGDPGCPNMGVENTTGNCSDQANHPVDCGDGYCWPDGTDCGMSEQTCGELTFRCSAPDQTASCCNGEVHLCSNQQTYCPSGGVWDCWPEGSCDLNAPCTFTGQTCN